MYECVHVLFKEEINYRTSTSVLRGLIWNFKITTLICSSQIRSWLALADDADGLNNLVIFTAILPLKKMCLLRKDSEER